MISQLREIGRGKKSFKRSESILRKLTGSEFSLPYSRIRYRDSVGGEVF